MPVPSEKFGVVVIGKNEGERLRTCINSLRNTAPTATIYVDSGSSDGSVGWATLKHVVVVELDLTFPFTAARARNAGFECLKSLAPDLKYVQFVDGDCELFGEWPSQAISFLADHADTCAVFGRRRERYPNASIYNYLCDLEWNVPVGEARSFGGDVMIRTDALRQSGGYRDDLIAGEEPELCVRLRAHGWHIWRIDGEMTLHDAAITRFSQWWKRNVRSGHAFAQGAYLHGATQERHWVWETFRAVFWGIALPLVCTISTISFPPWGTLAWVIFPAQIARRTATDTGPLRRRLKIGCLETAVRFAEAQGIAKFLLSRIFGWQTKLIEYK
jgi:glycosyltransferase involved in cell wall biosynthesis